MKNNNKNLGIYIALAVLVGAVGFIAYNKLSTSKLKVGNTSISSDDEDTTDVKNTKLFSSNNPVFASELNIKTPQIATDLLNAFK